MRYQRKSKKMLSSALATGLLLGSVVVPQVQAKASLDINYGEALQKAIMFYEFQQSGKLTGNERNNWRGDSCLEDGKDVGLDLTGGWFDAGDHIKFNLPMSYTASMLAWSYMEDEDVYKKTGQDKYILEQIKWANDYFIKCHPEADVYYYQVGDGGADHAFWGAAEILQMERPAYKVDRNNPGSAVCAQTAASLASCAYVFKDIDPEYSAECLRHAKELLIFSEETKSDTGYQEAAAGYYRSSSFYDDLSWGNMWVYLVTEDEAYLNKAKEFSKNWGKLDQTDTTDYRWTQCWDDVHYGTAMLLAKYDKTADANVYKQDIENNLDFWTVGKDGKKVKYTPKGLAYLSEWGSLRYATTTAFLASIYADWDGADKDKAAIYEEFAKSQADYALGSTGHSYVVGMGGENSSKNSHHRTAHGTWDNNLNGALKEARHILVGALVGGPGDADDYEDKISDYVKNEVACDYNAGFTGLMAKMYGDYSGTIDPNLSAVEEVGEEIFLEAGINAKDTQNKINFVELKAVVYNRTAWPARVTDNLTYRCFVDISDVIAAGYSAADMKVSSNYSQHTTKLSQLIPWDEANGIYYVEADLSGAKIYPGGQSEHKSELQFRIAAPGKWDFTNSPSIAGLGGSSQAGMTRATNFAVYDNGELVFGNEPGEGVVTYAPEVGITSPENEAVFEEVTAENPIVIKADATVQDSTIKKVEFFVDGEKIGETTKAPYEINFVPEDVATDNMKEKSYEITVKATAVNGKSTVSEAKTVTVVLPKVNAPEITLTAPVDGDVLDMSEEITEITLSADATVEDAAVKEVIFYVNGKKVGTDTTAPYEAKFTPAGTVDEAGKLTEYVVKAEAVADNGTKTTSEEATVKVQLPVSEKPVEPEKPEVTPGDSDISISNEGSAALETNTIVNKFEIKNNGDTEVDLSKLEVRYYYTSDGDQDQTVYNDHVALKLNRAPWYVPYTEKTVGSVVKMSTPTDDADSYIQIKIDSDDVILSGDVLEIATRTAKQNWSNYNQGNDYSYNDVSKVCVYYDGELVSGVEPQ